MVQRDLALPIPGKLLLPAATRAEARAVFDVSAARPVSPNLARPGGCWAWSVSVVALERRPGSGRRRSLPTVLPLTLARVWVCASPGLWPRPCPRLGCCRMRPLPGRRARLGPGDRSGNGTPCPPAGALARLVCQPTLGLLALQVGRPGL